MKFKCKAGCLAFALFFIILFSPGALETYYDDDEDFFDDDYFLMEGGGLTIVGSLSATQQMDVIDRETIEKINAADVPALLEEALGLGVTRYGPYGSQASVNLRGFDVKRIAILVDGVPVNSASSGNFDFYSINPISIERIEVIHGGSDTRYNVSGAFGGVINIVTVKQNKTGWRFGGSFSNTSYLPGKYNIHGGGIGNPQWQDLADSQNINLSVGYGSENYSINFSLFGNRAGNHFLYSDYYGFIRRKEGNEILDGGLAASYIRNFANHSKFIMSGSLYFGDKNIPGSGYATTYTEQKDAATRVNLMLEMPRAFHDDFSMEASLSHNWKTLHHGAGASASIHTENNLTAINRWAWYPDPKFALRFGGDYRFIHLDSTNTGLRHANRGGLYVTPEYSPAKNLLLIASVKVMTNGQEIIPIPKLGFSWAINDSLTLKNNYFRNFKFPDFDDLYWIQDGLMGNPDLKSEDGWGADLGVEYFVRDFLNFSSTLYGQWTENSIHWSNISGVWRPENHGEAVFIGLDSKADITIPFSMGILQKPVLSLSWLFQMSYLLTGGLTFKDDIRIPYMPVHTFGASLELPWKTAKDLGGSVTISGRYEGVRYTNTTNTGKLNSHFLVNIAYNQKVNDNIGVFSKVNNALNTRYFSYPDYPMPGISLTVGINMSFTKI